MITCYLRYTIDPYQIEAWRLSEETRCILSFERSFMRPVFAAEP
jgi:hypothetical protein